MLVVLQHNKYCARINCIQSKTCYYINILIVEINNGEGACSYEQVPFRIY